MGYRSKVIEISFKSSEIVNAKKIAVSSKVNFTNFA